MQVQIKERNNNHLFLDDNKSYKLVVFSSHCASGSLCFIIKASCIINWVENWFKIVKFQLTQLLIIFRLSVAYHPSHFYLICNFGTNSR